MDEFSVFKTVIGGAELLTLSGAARVLEASEATVRRLANRGDLSCIRIASGLRLFREADVEQLRTKRARR